MSIHVLPRRVALVGFALGAMLTVRTTALTITPSVHDFGSVPIGASSAGFDFTVALPAGGGPADTVTVTVTGPDAGDFTVDASPLSTTCHSAVWRSGACKVGVQFTPKAVGPRTATLVVADSRGNQGTATLKGTGVRLGCAGAPASCFRSWKGYAYQIEDFASAYSYPMAGVPNTTVDVSETAHWGLTVYADTALLDDADFYGQRDMTITTRGVLPDGRPCVSTVVAIDKHSGSWEGRVDKRVTLDPNSTDAYTITITVPAQKTKTVETRRTSGTCGAVIPNMPPTTTELEWAAWSFTIQCPVPPGRTYSQVSCRRSTPTGMTHLAGWIEKERKPNEYQSADQEAWLHESPVAVARSDNGQPLPVKIQTSWGFYRVR